MLIITHVRHRVRLHVARYAVRDTRNVIK